MIKNKIQFLLYDTYLTFIKKSAGSKMFQTIWAKVNGKKTDITKNGELSCAIFVSTILHAFGLIKEMHTTVNGLTKDIIDSKWQKISKPKIGSVLIWEEIKFNDGPHKHIGFYVGNGIAISNSLKTKVPAKHRWTYGKTNGKPNRKVIAIYHHPKLK